MNATSTRRIQVRRSGVHGRGVYALAPLAAGERVAEYRGERISDAEADRRHPADPANPTHTFYFSLEGGGVMMTPNCLGPPPRMGTFSATSVLTIQEPGPAGMAIQYTYGP